MTYAVSSGFKYELLILEFFLIELADLDEEFSY